MSILRNIYRKNFCSLGKQLLLKLFDDQPSAISGLVLQEVGLPGGSLMDFQWWKCGGKAYFQKSERNLRTASGTSNETVERPESEFDALMSLVEHADQPHLENFAGAVRDGVVFAVAWGSPKKLRHLSIKNPALGSRHDNLVNAIKANEWGGGEVVAARQ